MSNFSTTDLRTIRVYGTLAKVLKRRTFQAVVRSPQEAIRFLLANFPQLKSYIEPRHFQIRAGDLTIGETELDNPIGSKDVIHITPAICGAGGNGVTNIIVGTALIVTSILLPFTAPVLLPLGIGLALTGVAQLFVPVPSPRYDADDPQARNGYIFNGVQNTSRQGVAVPCVYGEIVTGSIVISSGTFEDEAEIETEFIAGGGDPDIEESNQLVFPGCTNDVNCPPGFCCDPSTGLCIPGDSCSYTCGETTWYRPAFWTSYDSCGQVADGCCPRNCGLDGVKNSYAEERYYTVPCGVLPVRMVVVTEPRIEFGDANNCDFISSSVRTQWYDANNCLLREYIWPGTVAGSICYRGGTAGEIPTYVGVNECFYGGCSQC